ncbi:MAG: TVP38/TMEM64 family protein [Parvibaculum sp.]|nr:TVP38/TMEM64 family protein [Parvibaculum sp.]
MSETQDADAKPTGGAARFWPLAVLALGFVLFFVFDLQRFVTLDTLRDNRTDLSQWVAANLILAILIYIAAYALMAAFSLPGALVATLTGGFLFGTWLGGAATVIGATIGASILFIAARTALADLLRSKAGGAIARMEEGFKKNAFSYLLFLRLVPAFPFWLVNLAPAFLGVSLRTFVTATFLGIIPGTFVFASLGNGLGAIFDAGGTPDLGLLRQPQVIGPLLALAALSLLPILYRRFRRAP